MKNDLSDIEVRIKRYWYSDGIVELSIGGLFILLGVYFGLQGYLDERTLVSIFLQAGLVVLMLAGAISLSRLVNSLKTRLTYPRTGFVEYRLNERDARQRRDLVMAVAMFILIAWTVLFKLGYLRGFDSVVLVIGIVAGVVFFTLRGKSSRVKRFPVLGLLSILLAIGLSLGGLSQAYRLAWYFGLLGIAVVISGGLVFRRYIDENPMPGENQHG